ncbi:hypothetical protein SASPL_126844 [Salvia splendens]|uniref:DUF7780 domain-containing protein n=1 Tax=Salvia splendens TaxID=180675 RepID=A0A8X8XHQ3_SALSN|nr:uncharacterized protein LOC121749333 [Salvia splendens]KAG6414126.1 hypothetical protein SASPL_126844 [Salvia splendens]
MGMTKQSKSNGEGWGMGFLLVFFSEEDENQESSNRKSNNLNQFSPSPSFTRTNSSQIIHKAQSTISICLLLLFTSLLLFTLSTLPSATSRRHLTSPSNLSHALQGMGTLYRRGTRAMTELVVAHAVESLTQNELKLFLRLFHRSPLASKSDLLIIFPSNSAAHDAAILEENDSFLNLLTRYQSSNISLSSPSFDVAQFTKLTKREKEIGEPIWGRKTRRNSTGAAESTRLSYGSVAGFDVEELDPENSLSGFLDHVPMNLRRWACYPMLLGRVRRNFKHVMIVDVREFLVLGDPLGRVRTQGAESVLVSAVGKHGKRNSERTHPVRVHSGVLMGGSRGIRRVCSKMLTDIVRASMQQQHRKKRNSVADAVLFNQLVQNDNVLKEVKLMVSTESMPELSSLGSKSGWHNLLKSNNSDGLIRVGNPNLDVNSQVMKQLCSFAVDSTVYSDCQ